MPEQRIRQQADAVEVDEDRRVAEERPPVGHVASPWPRRAGVTSPLASSSADARPRGAEHGWQEIRLLVG